MSESLCNAELTIREHYNPACRAMFLAGSAAIAAFGVFMCYGITDLYSSGESILEVVGVAIGAVSAFAVSYGLWHLHLELRISKEQVAARAWPFPWTVVPIDQVLASAVIQIDPFLDYGGWGLKGTERDRLIGGRGTTALRITYTHECGEERKLTFLSERADEAALRIAFEQTR